jgi:hypothetical protein
MSEGSFAKWYKEVEAIEACMWHINDNRAAWACRVNAHQASPLGIVAAAEQLHITGKNSAFGKSCADLSSIFCSK